MEGKKILFLRSYSSIPEVAEYQYFIQQIAKEKAVIIFNVQILYHSTKGNTDNNDASSN